MFRLALTRLLARGIPRRISANVLNTSIRPLSSQSKQKLPLGSIHDGQSVKRMGVQFRCQICDHTLQKTFTRQSYEKGVVIIRCDSCSNLHLIADNLGWFKDLTQDGKFKFVPSSIDLLLSLFVSIRNIAEMLHAKGETIHRVSAVPTEIDETSPTTEDQTKTN